jgi:hypothetical protein
MEGTPILNLATVKRLQVKKFIKKIRQINSSKVFVKTFIKTFIKQGHQSNSKFYGIYKSVPFMTGSRFLESPLGRQAEGELKKIV